MHAAWHAAVLAKAVQCLSGMAAQAKEGAIEEGSPAWAHMSAGALHLASLCYCSDAQTHLAAEGSTSPLSLPTCI